MKICMVAEFCVPYYNGGGEHRYYDMAKRLVELGHEVDLLTMKIAGDLEYEQMDGINIYHIGPKIENIPFRSGGAFIKYFFAVSRWLLTHKYDLIDAQAYSPLLSSSLMAKIKRTPIIGVVYDTSTTNNDQWLQSKNTASLMEKVLLKLPYNKILTISPATQKSLIEDFNVSEDNIELLYCGVDIKKFDKVHVDSYDDNRIIFVARLATHKHADDLIEVVKQIKETNPQVNCTIVGRGKEKENLVKMVDDYQLNDSITFKQDLTDEELIREIKESAMLVLPSTREGFGLVLAEANCCNKPVIAYASGGTVNVIDDGYSGYLVKPRDKDALKEKIELLLNDKQLQKQIGGNGRTRVEEYFDWDKIVDEYVDLAQSMIKK